MKPISTAIAVLGLLFGIVAPAAAQQPPPTPAPTAPFPNYTKTPTVSASIVPGQSDVGYLGTLAGDQSWAGTSGKGAGKGGGCTGPSYSKAVAQYGQTQVNVWLFGSAWWNYGPYMLPEVGPTPDAEHVGTTDKIYLVICDGVARSYGYVFPAASTGPAPVAARNVAQSVAGQIPLPGVSIGVAPRDKGLTGLNGWFWVAGMPAGGAFTSSANALGATINVEARPTSYVWDFGDGSDPVVTTSPGVAYPSTDGPAAVHHMYQTESTAGYPLNLTFVLAVRYQVNGGAWTGLGTVRRSIYVTYPVEQIVSAITSRS
jgi:hypothetical protein